MVTNGPVWLFLLMFCCCWKTQSLIVRTAFLRRAQTFVFPAVAAGIADNAGIRLLPSVHPSLIALWKVSNVAIFEGIVLHRAASEPVSIWLQHHNRHITPTILFPSTLAASISGIVLAAVSNDIVVHWTRVEYVGVLVCPMTEAILLQEHLQTSISESSSITVEVEVVQSSESGTYNGLHLVRFSLLPSPMLPLSSPVSTKASSPPVASTIPKPILQDVPSIVQQLLAGCVAAKSPCVMDGKTPLLSLVGIEAVIETTDGNHNTDHSHSSTSLKTSPASGLSPIPAVVKVTQEVPVKFIKYMRRENILHTRLTSHSQQEQDTVTIIDSTSTTVTPSTTAATATEASFMGLSFLVPAEALRPRPSSAILVEVALTKLAALRESVYAKNPSLPLRVLDLGTGSGALLLSLLHQAKNSSHNKQVGSAAGGRGFGRVVGVGIDLDGSALAAANSNAARANLSGMCRWLCHDFAHLGEEQVRRELANAVYACEESPQSNLMTPRCSSQMTVTHPVYGMVRGRVTQEGRGALVAEDKGMQAYKDICRAVALANFPVKSAQSNDRAVPVKSSIAPSAQSNDPAWLLPLLAPHGCMIFQGDQPTPLPLSSSRTPIFICNSRSTQRTCRVLCIYHACTYHVHEHCTCLSLSHVKHLRLLPFLLAPGGINGWRAVKRAVEEPGLGLRPQQGQELGPDRENGKGKGITEKKVVVSRRREWRVTEVVEDERGVKRCVVVQQLQPQKPQVRPSL